MPSTYTTRNRAEKQAPGENNNSWGSLLNGNMIDMFDQALDGMASYTLSGSKTLSTANGSSDEARCRYQNITSGTGGTVTIPNVEKSYIVRNNCTGGVTFTTGSGTSCPVPAKSVAIVVCEGGNVCRAFTVIGTFTINVVFDGGGAELEPDSFQDLMVDFPFEILEWRVLCGEFGGVEFDIWKDSYANFPPTAADTITASEHPVAFLSDKGQGASLTGWTTAIPAGSILRVNVEGGFGVTRATLALKCVRTG